MKENICEGCIYDVDRIKNDVEKYNVLENCLHCKRYKKEVLLLYNTSFFVEKIY